MKKLLFLLLMITSANVYAQNGWFLQPYAGFGNTKIRNKYYWGIGVLEKTFTYNGGFNVGYQARNISVSAGLAYLRTGSEQQATFPSGTPPYNVIGAEKYKFYYSHILLPICESYNIKTGSKLAIIPVLGMAPAYNLSEWQASPTKEKISREKFNNEYNNISLFGLAQISASFAISKYLSVFAGPSFSYMLTNMLRIPAGALYKSSQHNYAALCNVGMQYNLSHKKPTK